MSARKWTPEQRRLQGEAIRSWMPWKQSTGPKSPSGKAKSAKNAKKNNIYDVLNSMLKNIKFELKSKNLEIE